MSFALECERAEKLAKAGTLTESQARNIVNGILERAGGGESSRSPTVREFFSDWLRGKTTTKADGTVDRYTHLVKVFLESLGTRADKPLTALTSKQVETFLAMRSKAGLSNSTVRMRKSCQNHSQPGAPSGLGKSKRGRGG